MILGLNLSFAVKRWLQPDVLATMCKTDFGIDRVQMTWDLIDPWWPESLRSISAARYRSAFAAAGVQIDASFGGIASYSYPQLLSPHENEREIALQFFKRGIDLSIELGCKVMGSPVGGMDYADSRNPITRQERYQWMCQALLQLADYGKTSGLREIHIEATPLLTEFPHSPSVSMQLMKDVSDSAIPIKLLIDWGHALMKPLLNDKADMDLWLSGCRSALGSIHLQQTDGLLDRHWDFTVDGIVSPQQIAFLTQKHHLDDIPQYLEVVAPFEATDDAVYEGIKKSIHILRHELLETSNTEEHI